MNKQQLANRIWASANNMRNKIDANEYKDYILGLIFYKFLSDTEVKYFTETCGWEEDELPELVENYEDKNMEKKKNRGNEGVLIIDASKGFVKDGKQNKLRACDVKKIADTYRERKDIPGFSRVVSRDEIRRNEYNLNIPLYVDSSEAPVKYDIYSTMFGGIPNSEIADLKEYFVKLWDEQSAKNKQIKADKLALEKKTIETIEGLDMNGINQFLELKWICPITSAIEALPDAVIQKLADAITALNEKYAVTYNDIEAGIVESEQNLAELIGQLTGDEFAISGLSNLIKK